MFREWPTDGPHVLQVSGLDSEQIGTVAAEAKIVLIELIPQQASLEDAFMEITKDALEFAPHDHAADLVGADRPTR